MNDRTLIRISIAASIVLFVGTALLMLAQSRCINDCSSFVCRDDVRCMGTARGAR
jgi:hypothetical protein